jgi:hypothetical protein
MGARAIPQVEPPAEARADPQPGVYSITPRPKPLDRKTDKKFPLRTPRYTRKQILRGMTSHMSYEGMREEAPMIPLPVRSSLAQVVHVQKVQLSKYFSWIKPGSQLVGTLGSPEEGGYRVARVFTLIQTNYARSRSPRPVLGRRPAYGGSMGARAGSKSTVSGRRGMGTPQRFRKSLPVALVEYSPPVYGQGEGAP